MTWSDDLWRFACGDVLNISWSGLHLFSNLLPGLVLFLLFSLLGRDESQVERRLLWPRRRRRRPGRATPASAELLLVPMSAGQSPGKERQVRCCCYCETRGSRAGTNWRSLEKKETSWMGLCVDHMTCSWIAAWWWMRRAGVLLLQWEFWGNGFQRKKTWVSQFFI